MIAAWCPHMFTAPFLEMRKFFPEYPTCSSFQSLCNKTQGILWRVFKENVDVVGIDRNLNNFNIQFFACLANDAFCDYRDLAS
jgi:hypothetical protein